MSIDLLALATSTKYANFKIFDLLYLSKDTTRLIVVVKIAIM